MSRTARRSWWAGITPAGLLVIATAALVTLALTGATVVLYVRGDVDAAKDCALQASGALTATTALLARSRPDPAATIEQPATVTASTTEQPLTD